MKTHTISYKIFAWPALLCLVGLAFGGSAQNQATGRVVAIGDVHGDYAALVNILQKAGLADERLRWAGGNATLVQTGDFLDHGPQPRKVIDLLMQLEEQAGKAGGRVIVLLGDHEVMNVLGDLRDVAQQAYAEFVDGGSEGRRKRAWREYIRFRKQLAEKYKLPAWRPTEEAEKEWMAAHPPGYIEYRDAFGPEGGYGQWLRQRDAVARVGDTLFVHSGLSERMLGWPLEQINERARQELELFDRLRRMLLQGGLVQRYAELPELMQAAADDLARHRARIAEKQKEAEVRGQAWEPDGAIRNYMAMLETLVNYRTWLVAHPDGPLWFRGFAEWEEESGSAQVARAAEAFGVRRFVAGHVPQPGGRIRGRFNNRVFLIDTGMLARVVSGGRPSALEITGGRVTAIYPDQRVVLVESPAPRQASLK